MSKQLYSRDEVKTLLREAINKKQNAEPVVEDNKTEQNQKTYTREEVIALSKRIGSAENRNHLAVDNSKPFGMRQIQPVIDLIQQRPDLLRSEISPSIAS